MTMKIYGPYDEDVFDLVVDANGNESLHYKAGKAPKTRPREATRPLRTAGVTDVTPKKTPKKEA